MSESPQSSYVSESTSSSDNTGSSSISSDGTDSASQEELKNEGSSPIDMECQIQAERITKSLDKLVYQTKLAICIPHLLSEKILANVLTFGHLMEVEFILDQYAFPLRSSSVMNMSAIEDMQAGDISNRVNLDLSYLMCTLYSYPALIPHVERLTNKMKKDVAERSTSAQFSRVTFMKQDFVERNSIGQLSQITSGIETPPGLSYLLKLEEFRDLMVERVNRTAAEELSAIIRTRKLEKSNNACLEKIEEQTKYLREEKADHNAKNQQKQKLIEDLKQEIKTNEQKSYVKRQKQILDSERQMVLATRVHKVKYKMLKEEEVESRELYDNTVASNMRAEKLLRDRRRKVETQLQSWVQKYDTEMQAKQDELDEITQQYDEEVEECKRLKLKLEEQDKEYYPLMAEKEEEYHQEMTVKLNEFIIEHAARVIQHAWRTVLRNRDEKKKLQKIKRQMEAQREAEAKKAMIEAKKQELLAKKQAAKERAIAKAEAKAAKLEAKARKGNEQQGEPESK